jgi:putative spermidine/putrescine transport system ATP-binding protein
MLFPHMTIEDNIAYGLKMRKVSLEEKKEKTQYLLRWFDLEEKAKNYPTELSAGQQQRVAIARALIVNPMLLLLDEPFANLDKNLKMDTALFIKKTQKEFGITTIMVTHDQEEAFFISDRVGILINGALIQIDKPEIIYHKPVNLTAAQFLGQVNTIPFAYLSFFHFSSELQATIATLDKTEHISFRYESVSITPDINGPGEVIESLIWGKTILYKIRIRDIIIGIYVLHSSLKVGDKVIPTLHQIINKRK